MQREKSVERELTGGGALRQVVEEDEGCEQRNGQGRRQEREEAESKSLLKTC